MYSERGRYVINILYILWTPRSITLPRSRCACGVIIAELVKNFNVISPLEERFAISAWGNVASGKGSSSTSETIKGAREPGNS